MLRNENNIKNEGKKPTIDCCCWCRVEVLIDNVG